MNDILATTIKVCTEFQEASAGCAAEARMFPERDLYAPRTAQFQRDAAFYANEARIRLDRINGHA